MNYKNLHETLQSNVPIIHQEVLYSRDMSHTHNENILAAEITIFDSKAIETNTPSKNILNNGPLDSCPMIFNIFDTEVVTETAIEDHPKKPVHVTPLKHSSTTMPLSKAISEK